ncbi:hypothetical protein, partial [Halioxenophilus aromaticivorans]|uniref:hypothetical protein n=1 Tax=Halioxenophilus aromaticivorans TaxID=1306992 RepID=UPI0031EBD1E6
PWCVMEVGGKRPNKVRIACGRLDLEPQSLVICGGHVATWFFVYVWHGQKMWATVLKIGALFRGLLRTNGRRVCIYCFTFRWCRVAALRFLFWL